MSGEGPAAGRFPEHHHLEADAVCEACGTVNPEGTLICKTCGNNLRDQRLQRIQSIQMAEGIGAGGVGFRFLTGALAVLGLLLVLWAALNAETVANWAVGIGQEDALGAGQYWNGALGRRFDEIAAELRDNPLTPARRDAAKSAARRTPPASIEGRYVLAYPTRFGQERAGEAVVRQIGDDFYTVASIPDVLDFRGVIRLEGPVQRPTARDAAVRLFPDERGMLVYGFAQWNPEGYFDCFGQGDAGEDSPSSYFSVRAYPVETGAAPGAGE